ncbi:MAG: hypothetical protein Q9227_004186 [Pyrenula ochraceoflavens]
MKLRQLLSRQPSQDSTRPRKHVPLIDTPLEDPGHHDHHDHLEPPSHSQHDGSRRQIRENSQAVLNDMSSDDLQAEKYHHIHDLPKFKRHHEASSIELFYDLFFVANLATFTSNSEIADGHTLASYIGFFSLMWFTWLQTSLFDVRFGTESVFSRLCKACSFGIMLGFAIAGPQFKTWKVEENTRSFRSLSLILMASRLILMIQYGVVLVYVRPWWKKTFVPLAVIMVTLFVTAMVFLGLFFAFQPDRGSHAYAGFYVVLGIEAIVTIATSMKWRFIGFKHTHLVERVGLLTLIIMGEGIIGMTKSVSYIMKGSTYLAPSVIGGIICSVLIIYFLWMLYFDQIEHERFGTIRQQIWALLHFPLHVAILLTVEGVTQFISWRIAYSSSDWALTKMGDSWLEAQTGKELTEKLESNLEDIKTRFHDAELPDFSEYFKAIANYTNTAAENDRVQPIIDDMQYSIFSWACKIFNIQPLEDDEKKIETPFDKFIAIFRVFRVIFIFFFACAGAVLVILAIMYWFGKSHKSRGEWLSVLVRLMVGVAVSLLAIMATESAFNNWVNFLSSAWILPTIVLAYGLGKHFWLLLLDIADI